ncbi:ABC transporter permease [Pseudoflavonifractor sp. MSJ-37]|uniref:ABC transporter permease n=1 Tax=Pseudoflavonifractor sp. MSJ-37 TaxID=2841531 RepID=UPI001C10721B|nr:ABC transporter permease [Pseudoflavonifractor sp. MSJ-37]MBU5434063.1 ABC transporter permease [Pseudoflavonifractor sp. MSJ-37]
MNLLQAFKMAFKSIACKKMRSFLTMLGIIIGVASVVIMVSVVQGQNAKNLEYFEKMGSNKINVSAYVWNGQDVSTLLYDYCLSMPELVDGVTPNIQVGQDMTIKYGAQTLSTNNWDNWEDMIQVVLGSDQYGVCNNYELGGGRDLSYLDIQDTNNVCILGGKIKETLFNFIDPVGREITVNGRPFQVVGWYQRKDLDGWPELDNIVLLPYTFNRTLNSNSTIDSYVVKAKSATATVEAMTRLDAYLKGFINDNNGYSNVSSDNSSANDIQQQNTMQAMVLGGIAAISLLVGGIGIMNIMLVTVTERTREIGIRKAIGAERRSIIAQFLIEAAVICGIGGLLGIGMGYVGTLIAGKFLLGESMLLPSTPIAVGAFLFSVVLGVLFGMYPAIKASGLQPVEALRAE